MLGRIIAYPDEISETFRDMIAGGIFGLADHIFLTLVWLIFFPFTWLILFPVVWLMVMWLGCAYTSVALMMLPVAFCFFLAFYTDVSFRIPACALVILQSVAVFIMSESESVIGLMSITLSSLLIAAFCVALYLHEKWNDPRIVEIKESTGAEIYRMRWANFHPPYKRRENKDSAEAKIVE